MPQHSHNRPGAGAVLRRHFGPGLPRDYYYIMIGVWYAVTEIKITGPMFFCSETIKSQ
jgi:hypothetical protein